LILAHHLLDWLSILNFDADLEVAFSSLGGKEIRNPETALEEIKASLSLGYAIKAIKRDYRLIPIEPQWSPLKQLVSGPLIESPQLNRQSEAPHD